jgi:tRNA U38,U39,U40 pseudouridine synthase TruA
LSAVVDAGRADAGAVAASGQVVTEKSGQSEKWKDKKNKYRKGDKMYFV